MTMEYRGAISFAVHKGMSAIGSIYVRIAHSVKKVIYLKYDINALGRTRTYNAIDATWTNLIT